MTDHPGTDALVALALAELDAGTQERLVAHLAACPECRDEYAGLSDGLAQALAATPSVAPPAGFSGRVLAAMSASGAATPALPRRPRRPVALLAAAVLLGLLAGIGGTLAASSLFGGPPATPHHATVAAPLLTARGEAVGSAGLATLDGRPYLVLNVTTGRPGATYECVLVARDGSRSSGGSWSLSDEDGTGVASGSWVVPLPGEPPASVELVAPAGTVWSTGTF